MKNYRHIKIFLIVLTLLLVYGCCTTQHYISRSYINTYKLYDGIELSRSLSRSTKNIDININVTHRVGSFSENAADKDLYEKICIEYGDTAYNSDIFIHNNIIPEMSNYPHFTSINVTSDKDFDENHPAGTPLNDVIKIIYNSAYNYVSSGYKSDVPMIYNNDTEKLLCDLQPNDLALGLLTPSLAFIKEPDVLNVHTLTVECTNHTGESIKAQINYDFRLPEGYIGNYENIEN